MKKYLVGLMVIGALLGFVGCGGSSSSGEKTEQTGTTDTGTTDSTVQKAFKFSKEFLNGKTLYNVYEDCDDSTYENGGKCSTWGMSVFKFTDTQVTGYEVKDPTHNLKGDYTISSKGYIILPDTTDKNAKDAIKAIEKTDKYISLIWDSEGSSRLDSNTAYNDEYFFFNEADAKKFMDEKNRK